MRTTTLADIRTRREQQFQSTRLSGPHRRVQTSDPVVRSCCTDVGLGIQQLPHDAGLPVEGRLKDGRGPVVKPGTHICVVGQQQLHGLWKVGPETRKLARAAHSQAHPLPRSVGASTTVDRTDHSERGGTGF